MKFGTIQSISKTDDETAELDSLDFDSDEVDTEELGGEVEDALGSAEEELANKLIGLKAEIDDILADLGYGDEESDDDFDFEMSDDEESFDDFNFDIESPDEEEEVTDDSFLDDEQIGDEPSADTGEEELDSDVLPDEDEDFQGDIRTVAGANLVYKRKSEDGNYEELWIYNVGNDIRQEMQIRRAILAGTDIVPTQTESDDGTQKSETTTLGNVQYLKITGLPN